MIVLDALNHYNDAPWEIPFSTRYTIVNNAVHEGKKVALHFYEKADTSTFRYRCYNIMRALELGDEWASTYFFANELDKIHDLLPHIHLPIIVRMRWTVRLANFASLLHALGHKIVYDVDDLVFDLDMLPILVNTLNLFVDSNVYYNDWFALVARHQATANMADAFTTTNDHLGEALQSKFGKPYVVVPNALNQEQIDVSAKLYKQKTKNRRTRIFEIGYFSGSPSHINDFKIVYRELKALMEKYQDIQLQVVGFMEFPVDMQNLTEQGRVVKHDLVDFIELQRLTAQVDVSIAPLVQNIFTNCKSELKYFESAVVGTPIVATPVYTFERSIRDGENGFLCQPGEWFNTLEKIYLGSIDVAQITKTAREESLQIYSPQNQAAVIINSYNWLRENVNA